MNNMVMSTRKTTNSRRNTGIVLAILVTLIGAFIVAFYIYAKEHTNDDNAIFLLLLGLFLVGDGMIMVVKNCVNASTYVDIYKDRFVGKGIQNLGALGFNIKTEEVNNISIEGFWLHIHTSSGAYKVMTDKNTAQKVFNYYISLKG